MQNTLGEGIRIQSRIVREYKKTAKDVDGSHHACYYSSAVKNKDYGKIQGKSQKFYQMASTRAWRKALDLYHPVWNYVHSSRVGVIHS